MPQTCMSSRLASLLLYFNVYSSMVERKLLRCPIAVFPFNTTGKWLMNFKAMLFLSYSNCKYLRYYIFNENFLIMAQYVSSTCIAWATAYMLQCIGIKPIQEAADNLN